MSLVPRLRTAANHVRHFAKPNGDENQTNEAIGARLTGVRETCLLLFLRLNRWLK